MPTRIDAVVFDIHATLVDQGSAEEWLDRALLRCPHESTPANRAELIAFLDRIWEGARVSDPTSSRDRSFADHRRVFLELLDAGPGTDPGLAAALYDVLLDTWHAYDDTVPTLVALRGLGVGVCLVSNAGLPVRDVLDRERISGLVDHVVLSYEVGSVKPEPAIFQAALSALDLPAERVLMVGDNAHDDGGAAALGIRTLILPRTSGPTHGLAAVPALVRGVNAALG